MMARLPAMEVDDEFYKLLRGLMNELDIRSMSELIRQTMKNSDVVQDYAKRHGVDLEKLVPSQKWGGYSRKESED